MYKVMNHLTGFVNCFTGIAIRPNATLAWNEHAPLGQRSLVIRIIKDIKLDAEILIGYGPEHKCKDKDSNPKSREPKKGKKLKPQTLGTPVLSPAKL